MSTLRKKLRKQQDRAKEGTEGCCTKSKKLQKQGPRRKTKRRFPKRSSGKRDHEKRTPRSGPQAAQKKATPEGKRAEEVPPRKKNPEGLRRKSTKKPVGKGDSLGKKGTPKTVSKSEKEYPEVGKGKLREKNWGEGDQGHSSSAEKRSTLERTTKSQGTDGFRKIQAQKNACGEKGGGLRFKAHVKSHSSKEKLREGWNHRESAEVEKGRPESTS